MGKPIEYKKIEMNISWISTGKEKISWIVKGKNNVPGFIAKNVFCGNYDENVKDAYLKILRQCNGISNSNAKDALKYRTYSFIVLDTKWAAEKFTNFKNLVNTDPVLMGKIVISESSKDEYDRQKKEYDKKNISTDAKNTNFDQTNGKKEIKKKAPADNEKLREEIKDARAQMVFCDENIVKTLKTSYIVDVLAGKNGFFPSEEMKEILLERYKKMRENYLKTDWTDSNWTQKGPCSDSEFLKIVPQNRDYDAALLQVPGEYCYQAGTGDWKEKLFKTYDNIGHDMPVWLYYKNDPQNRPLSQRPRVMIVSQDPLRSGYPTKDVLLLSTPWAPHSLKFIKNANKMRVLVSQIIHLYLSKGVVVYLTDFNKLYCRNNPERVKILKKIPDSQAEFLNVIKQETDLFQPQTILILGRDANESIVGTFNENTTDPVPLPTSFHPAYGTPVVYSRFHPGRMAYLPKDCWKAANYWLVDFKE